MSTALHPAGSPVAATLKIPSRLDPRVLVDRRHRQHLRWQRGERLEHLFEQQCERLRAGGRAGQLCVDAPGAALTYEEVDARANRLARHLLARSIGPGHRVALLFDDPVQAYVAMLAVLKAGAAYVPLDPGFPADRIAYIVSDAAATAVLSLSHLRKHLTDVRALVVAVDDMAHRIGRESPRRVTDAERGPAVDELAYIIYTSGSTGRPKGVAIEHPSIVNFVRVAAEVYGYRPDDRVYQGLTIAFDFSFEEIWVPWAVGATLVPKPAGGSLLGVDLHRFLTERRVTAMCCVPTLLATVEEDLPALCFLLVSGEACPHDLITRWHRPGRRFLNVYGPTEATVTCTWAVVDPDRPVTIGVPLPTYATVVLDPDDPTRALPHGEVGEIGVTGIGLAKGYLNRDDLTTKAFVPDFLGVPGNVSQRIYRTGDLGRVTPDGDIEYLGRIDLQVKIRGYRIELTEIESVMLQVPGITQAVVDTYEPVPGQVELVGYYSLRTDTAAIDEGRLLAHLEEHLPPYMVPAYLEHLAVIPMTTSDKADRKNLPPPTARRGGSGPQEHVEPATGVERTLAELLARTLGVERVSATAHFFDDLGANSLLMAQFSAKVRKEADLPAVSMRELYQHATVRDLAATLGDAPVEGPAQVVPRVPAGSTARYVLTGAVQLVLFLGSLYLGATVMEHGFLWVSAASGWRDTLLRSVEFSAASLLAYAVLPIVAKWTLIGRAKPREYRVWGLTYLRYWLVKTLIRVNPMALFAGSPLYAVYLRALGAKIGPGTIVLSRVLPASADLLTIGAGAVVRKDSVINCYRVEGGVVTTGPVTIGRDALVGEATVLDIGTSVGDGAQLGHSSSLHSGQHVPEGERWHGSPARPTGSNYRVVTPLPPSRLRRVLYSLWQLASLLVVGPVAFALGSWFFEHLLATDLVVLGSGSFHLTHLWISSAVYLGGVIGGVVSMLVLPRLIRPFLKPDRVYPLYGIRYSIHRTIGRLTNSAFYFNLFGDSSLIPHFMRAVGYDMGRIVQTGSNFGAAQKHENPYLTSIGTGTMVSDGLSVMNADYTSTSFRVTRVAVGTNSFFGNAVAYPSGGRTGDNCLLATKVAIPVDGPVRENVGLLGSPAFEIPRSVQRDSSFDHYKDPAQLPHHLARKLRHNLVSMALLLLVGWVLFVGTTLIMLAASEYYPRYGELAIGASVFATLLFGLTTTILVERAALGFRRLEPRFCSIYDPYFWRHERFWKLLGGAPFAGTPFKPLFWRLLGVRVGKRLFDDGSSMPEKTLVALGDDVTLNAGAIIQCHSLEDGTFKSDHTVVGDRATIGVAAFVHYGVTVGENAVLEADAFLMKGEEMAPYSRWGGNPATELRDEAPTPPVAAAPASEVPALEEATVRVPARRIPDRPVPPPRRPVPAAPAHSGRTPAAPSVSVPQPQERSRDVAAPAGSPGRRHRRQE